MGATRAPGRRTSLSRTVVFWKILCSGLRFGAGKNEVSNAVRTAREKVLDFGFLELPMPANSPSSIVRFGNFEVNFQTGELRQRGQKIKLQEQPFQVLAALLEHSGELVTREELRNKLWPADTFVDFDHSLNAAIKRLRDALGESADAPVFIETLARRGYRFIAPVHGSSASGVAEITPALEQRRSFFWTHPIAIALITLDGKASVLLRSSNFIAYAVPSPDGRLLAIMEVSPTKNVWQIQDF